MTENDCVKKVATSCVFICADLVTESFARKNVTFTTLFFLSFSSSWVNIKERFSSSDYLSF